jgi:chromosome segregation and condensation protein ScpB
MGSHEPTLKGQTMVCTWDNLGKVEQRVIKAVASGRAVTRDDLEASVKVGPPLLKAALQDLVERGLVRVVGSGSPKAYQVTDAGTALVYEKTNKTKVK